MGFSIILNFRGEQKYQFKIKNISNFFFDFIENDVTKLIPFKSCNIPWEIIVKLRRDQDSSPLLDVILKNELVCIEKR